MHIPRLPAVVATLLVAVPPAAPPELDDGDIFGILVTLDANEVAAAKLALEKTLTDSVRAFAQTLEREHAEHLRKSDDLADKLDVEVDRVNSETLSLAASGAAAVAKLSVKSGKEFENAYLDEMIEDHNDAIKLIDDTLLKEAKKSELKDWLRSTREAVAAHLARAKRLRATG